MLFISLAIILGKNKDNIDIPYIDSIFVLLYIVVLTIDFLEY
jgi:hypothetical protein